MRLKQSQRIFKKLLTHKCDVYNKKRIRLNGQWRELFIREEHKAKCRLSVNIRATTDYVKDERQVFPTPFTIYTLPINVKQDSRILLGGNWYEVKAVPRNPSLANHHLELPVEIMSNSYVVKNDGDMYFLENEV